MNEWPDDATVRSFGPRMRCTRCGKLGRRLCPIGSNGSTDLIAGQRPAIILPRRTPRAPLYRRRCRCTRCTGDDSDLWCSALPSRKTRTPLPGFCDDRSPVTRMYPETSGAVQRRWRRSGSKISVEIDSPGPHDAAKVCAQWGHSEPLFARTAHQRPRHDPDEARDPGIS
jgi:hypothetical protein